MDTVAQELIFYFINMPFRAVHFDIITICLSLARLALTMYRREKNGGGGIKTVSGGVLHHQCVQSLLMFRIDSPITRVVPGPWQFLMQGPIWCPVVQICSRRKQYYQIVKLCCQIGPP